MLKTVLCLAIFLVYPPNLMAYDRDISYKELLKCREYRIAGKYEYKDPFLLSSFWNNNARANETMRLKMFVMADRDANILLSKQKNVAVGEECYEIVIGGVYNTISMIRSRRAGSEVNIKMGSTLSALYPTEIKLVLTKDGYLTVSLPGYKDPYLEYKFEKQFDINYVAFSSYEDVQSRWFIDCPDKGFAGHKRPSDIGDIDIRVGVLLNGSG